MCTCTEEILVPTRISPMGYFVRPTTDLCVGHQTFIEIIPVLCLLWIPSCVRESYDDSERHGHPSRIKIDGGNPQYGLVSSHFGRKCTIPFGPHCSPPLVSLNNCSHAFFCYSLLCRVIVRFVHIITWVVQAFHTKLLAPSVRLSECLTNCRVYFLSPKFHCELIPHAIEMVGSKLFDFLPSRL